MNQVRILIVGSGGREHALGWALSRSPSVARVDAAPGNPGLGELGTLYPIAAEDREGLLALAQRERYDLVVVGPEGPLAAGLADRLREEGIAVFGPGASGARLEASKAFSKEFMQRHGIPTARFRVVRSRDEARAVLDAWGAPIVVKASGLAAGKGVLLCSTRDQADEAVAVCFDGQFGEAGGTVVLEEFLTGEELSVFVITDGRTARLLPGSQDHKRAYDGDQGPNTGGMGAYSPAPRLDAALRERIEREVIGPTLTGLTRDGIDFRGLLYVGLMLTPEGPSVLEYNVRFGDPETQAVLPRVEGDLARVLHAAALGRLETAPALSEGAGAAACVVAAAGSYPGGGSRGAPITGIAAARALGALVFHAGTALAPEGVVTAGGRVLNVVGRGDTLASALAQAYAALDVIDFEGMRWRTDIGHRALPPPDLARTGTGSGDKTR